MRLAATLTLRKKNCFIYGFKTDLNSIKTPVEIIKEGTFRGTYFRDIYSGVNRNWYRQSWK